MKILKIAFFMVLISMLAGCSVRPVVVVVDSDSSPVAEGFNVAPSGRNTWLTGSAVKLKGERGVKDIKSKLFAKNILLAKKNNTVLLIMSNKDLFEIDSANFTTQAYSTLDLVVDLLSYYDNPYLVITGYGAVKYLAAERASRVREYLWNAGVDASFVYSKSEQQNQNIGCVIIKYKE